MINDLKLGIKILRYGLNVKAAFTVAIIFLVMGAAFQLFIPFMPFTGLYTGMCGTMFVQTICSVSVSSMVQTSALKRRLQTSVPTIVSGGYMLVMHTVFLFLKWIGCTVSSINVFGHRISDLAFQILMDAVLMVVIVIYTALALKAFWPSTVLFAVVYFGGTYFYSNDITIMEAEAAVNALPLGLAIALSYAVIIVGTILIYLILKALYKKPYSRMSFESLLKRAK